MARLTKKTYVKLVLICALCVILCAGLLGQSLVGCSAFVGAPSLPDAPDAPDAPARDGSYVEVLNETVSPDAFSNISIDWLAGTARVRVVPDAEADGMVRIIERVRGNVGKDRYLHHAIDDGWLKIDYWQTGPVVFLGFGCAQMGSKHLELVIPESVSAQLGELVLSGASGSYALEGTTSDKLSVELASGRLQASDVSAKDFRIELASGEASVAGGISDDVKVSAASGTVSLVLAERAPRALGIDIASGNVRVELPPDAGFTAEVDKASGTFDCAFASTQRDGVYESGDKACDISVEMMSGTVSLVPHAS